MSSRWAKDDDADAKYLEQRKKQRQEKKRLKEDHLRAANKEISSTALNAKEVDNEVSTRPTKRQRTRSPSRDEPSKDVSDFDPTPTSFQPSKPIGQYDILNNIEEGSYGFVSRARVKASGEIVALKRLKMDRSIEGFPVTGMREIQTLQACSHSHIVNLRDIVVGGLSLQDVYLVMDFIEHDLKTLLEDISEPFLPSETKTLMLQICSATEYLHSNWILHRDLKTSNILMNNRGEIKLADFGMARYTGSPAPKLTQLVVTLWYRAPELLLGVEEYGFEIDIWSIGCVFAELLTREPVFQGKNEVSQLSEILNLLGMPSTRTWPNFRSLPNAKALYPLLDNKSYQSSNLNATKFPYLSANGLHLLSSMLSLNPDDRPTAGEIISHSYFKENPRPKPKEMLPTFPSKAGQEKRSRKETPQAPHRGDAPGIGLEDFATTFGSTANEPNGSGFSLRMG